MNNITVRRAVEGDAREVVRVTRDAFEKYAKIAEIAQLEALEETAEQVEREIKNAHVYVAELNNEIVGSLRIVPGRMPGTADLTRFGVCSRHQGLGVGGVLMDAVDKDMPTLGISELYLHTASKVTSLIRFYYSRGFYIESTSDDRGYLRAHMVKEY